MIRTHVLPLLITTVAVLLASWYFYETGRSIRSDKWLALVLVIVWGLFAIQMLLITPAWRLLELGVLVMTLGVAFFFAAFVGALWDWWDSEDWLNATYRGCFLVSALLLLPHSLNLLWQRIRS